MSQHIRDTFAQCQAEGRAAFVTYVTAGYPKKDDTVPILLGLEAGGADIIELGVPFSDPLADGTTIQAANQSALDNGVTMRDCLSMVSEARSRGLRAPVILMGYYNPFLAFGEEQVVRASKEAGVNGFIVSDLPPEEAKSFLDACHAHGLSFVPMIAPTTTDRRMLQLAATADSFLYCVSVTGVTGARQQVSSDLPELLRRIRVATSLPVAVGFGVATREHFLSVASQAQGVVIGSAIIRAIDNAPDQAASAVEQFVSGILGRS
eukprot:TRINITY_DN18982_c0_g1_i2.p1 TRINITY_DN18982_c0_g1~~TRINITY_DN18982_c0_g1_i2.p1  ORF type:complete len:264 (-),score=81.10 TRINITY_DN18982_c0_g1_i2:40-831(-)